MLAHWIKAACVRKLIRHEARWMRYASSALTRKLIHNAIVLLAEEGF
jgi:hypothetical protein